LSFNFSINRVLGNQRPLSSMIMKPIEQKLSDKVRLILEKIKQPGSWQNPLLLGLSENLFTRKRYRGINMLLLEGGQYATFRQIQEYGGKVKKGAKGHPIFFFKMLDVMNKKTCEAKTVPILKHYMVF